jgi:hypothetical protein
MLKKILTLTISIVIFTGCGTPPTVYDSGKVNITFTEEWNLIQNPSFIPKNILKDDESIVFIMNHNNDASITVVKKKYQEELILEKFISSNLSEAKTLDRYSPIKESKLRISGQKTSINTFKALGSTYIQTFLADDNNAYIITAIIEKELTPELNTEILKTIKSIKINP